MRKSVIVKRAISVAAMGLLIFGTAPRSRAACVGDCHGDGEVTVDEIITMVNIALGTATLDTCTVGDANGDGEITVDEVITAVNNTLSSCPAGGALGTRHFVLNQQHSQFIAVLSPGFALPLGSFKGQTNGVVEPAFLDLKAGEPNSSGLANIDVTASSEYLFIDARPTAPLVLCIKPIVPAVGAGVVECNGGLDFSIQLSVDHNIGQIGMDGFTAPQCLGACTTLGCGKIESPNQICAAGLVGEQCHADADCNSTGTSTDGKCGLGRLCLEGNSGTSCSSDTDCDTQAGAADGRCAPEPKCTDGNQGMDCRADADCDTTADAADGVCGNPGPDPGVCNSGTEAGQVGGDSG
ncbi:MAG TPA: hypothetical protein VMT89_03560, partial [Candidatus Acidoferrales bacterium]|nr:hypothetical protein [Candidatus Acidoferrales bacterium]